MIQPRNTNKSSHINANNKHKQPQNSLLVYAIYFTWIMCAIFSYRVIFDRYGLISNIILRVQLYKKEEIVKNMTYEKNAILHRIDLIKNNDIDLLEELSIRYLNKIPAETQVLVD
ncbi:MAG: hypothetical protein LBU68_01825 [Rickettsiales bacterium]|jgi:hypothetical protein|nr:hypothetical protein [Rickettsiales bacterium]